MHAGFQLRQIDRFMCSPHAEIIGAAIAAIANTITLLFYSGIHLHMGDLLHVFRTRGLFFAVFSGIFAIGGWWTVRAWKQLWRCGRSPWERMVYDHGVRLFRWMTAASIVAIITSLGWQADAGAPFGPLMMTGALGAVVFGLPVSLHLGYFWGNAFAKVVGVERDPRVEIGDPPHPASLG